MGALFRQGRFFCLLAVLLLGAPAVAQEATVLGTIDAEVDGEALRWYQIALDDGDGVTPLSSWANVVMTVHDVTMQGFLEPRFMLDRTLAISLSLGSGLPQGCPCTFDDFSASVLYLTGGSMSGDLYDSGQDGGSARVVIDVFEPVEEGAYRVDGSFEATLVYVESFATGPDPTDTIQVSGTFSLDRLPEDPLD